MRILLADNDEQFLDVVKAYLSANGHVVETTTSGLGCINMLREFSPELLFLDRELRWGGSNGVLAQMANESTLTQIPVILVSNGDKLEKFNSDIAPLLAGWIEKPFWLGDLLPLIEATAAHVLR